DAMAGPSPVSALIHAATMVTAGVYLIARTNVLFMLAPAVQLLVAVIGALTLLLAGFSALAQHDLKRILAYSTISQIGYMFLALGLGAWSAAIFHFMTHAFFKALLFLAGGAVILVLDEEHDIFKMGGLRKKLPVVFYTFLVGSASLAALPLVTAGFFSKDEIIWNAWAADKGSPLLWIAAVGGAFLTSLYTFRMVFVTFFGETKHQPSRNPGKVMTIPLIILAVFSVIAGYIELPGNMGNVHFFSGMIQNVLPVTIMKAGEHPEFLFQIIAILITLLGIYLAYRLYYRKSALAVSYEKSGLNHFFLKGWGFDVLYDLLIVRPVIWLSEINRKDFIDQISKGIAFISLFFNQQLSYLQNGKVRWYVMAFAIGIIFILSIMMNV
ncbi:MAG TPA: NADH-quinone oxidoreductase subunit L, partial [Bacteroidales bacterium]|nr:NADH-quinone oxidoreductase subunit L [Bacteroidales bacterium]